MILIEENIKIYNNGNYYYIGAKNSLFRINGNYIGSRILGMTQVIKYTGDLIVNIDNSNIFLTKDNLLLLPRNHTVIDLNNKKMYRDDYFDFCSKMKNLSDRTHITLKNG
jgi:hypothetical protein